MRTMVDIPENEMNALDRLARVAKVSRESLIRRAVQTLIQTELQDRKPDAFGLWGDRAIDGLTYQEELRREW